MTLPDRARHGNGGPGGGYGPPPGAGTASGTNPPTARRPGRLPGRGGGAPGAGNDAKFQKAMQACAKLRPQGGRGGYGAGGGAQRRPQIASRPSRPT